MKKDKSLIPIEVTPEALENPVSKVKSKKNYNHHAVIPLELIISYAEKGLSLLDIGKIAGVTKGAIWQRLKKAGYSKERLQLFKQHRADVIAFKSAQVLEKMDLSKIEVKNTTDVRNMATVFGILTDKERLERGQSTENVLFNDLTKEKDKVDEDIVTLQNEINKLEENK